MIQFLRRPVNAVAAPLPLRIEIDAELAYRAIVFAGMALGVFVRAYQVLRTDFPLNDGGLFFAMTRDLEGANFRIPAFTSYNGGRIPFAYPPLGFYLAGVLDRLTPLGLVEIFRFVPLLGSCLCIVAVFWLGRAILGSRVAVAAAVVAFAFLPRSFIWLLMGGGVTRALGYAFALLALLQVYRLYHDRDRGRLLPAILLSAATVLCHLETGWFLAFSIAVFWLVLGRNRHGIQSSVLLLAGTLVLTAPWFLTVVTMHGLQPFLAANATGGTFFKDHGLSDLVFVAAVRAAATSEPYFPVIGALGLFGAAVSVATGRYLLPLWLFAIILLDIRSFSTFSSAPVALLAGVAIADVVMPLLQRAAASAGEAPGRAQVLRRPILLGLSVPGLAILFFGSYYISAGAFVHSSGAEEAVLVSLSPDEREAMQWIADSTPPGSRFLVIPSMPWESDQESEWFPVLAHRPSVATVQGNEWLPNNAFERVIWMHDLAWGCAGASAGCLATWESATGVAYSYVYLPATAWYSCCSTLLSSLRDSTAFRNVYDGPGGAVFEALDW